MNDSPYYISITVKNVLYDLDPIPHGDRDILTGSAVHPASYPMDAGGCFFPEIKYLEHEYDH
jgi:hypothetical protein